MKKALTDVKSFVTVIMTIGFVIFTALRFISGEKYYDVFLIIVSFYFGTQYQKKVNELETKEETKE